MEKILFLHQPKCGGTTIFSYLEQCYPSEKILFCYYNHFKPENQKVYKNFDNLFHSRYNDTNYYNNIDILKYDLICGHNISQLLYNSEILKNYTIITNFRNPFKIFKSLYYQKIGEILRGECFSRCDGNLNNFLTQYEKYLFGSIYYFDNTTRGVYSEMCRELNELVYNDNIKYFVEAEDTLEFIKHLKGKYNLLDNYKKEDDIFRTNKNPLYDKESYFNLTEKLYKEKFKEDYKLYHELLEKKFKYIC